MNRIKFFAIALFLLVPASLYFYSSPNVSGQTGTLSAPLDFEASVGSYTTKIGLTWDASKDATTYRIFRNSINDSASATEIGTTSAPYFFDSTAAQNVSMFYWVRAENAERTSGFSEVSQGLRANGTPNGPFPPIEPPVAPAGNPVTAAKATLGKVLFWEEQLSSTRTVSCGTCHVNSIGGSDPRSIISDLSSTHPGPDGVFGSADDIVASPGVPVNNSDGLYSWDVAKGIDLQVTGRKTNSTINAAYSPELFWDGRATSEFRDPVTNAVVLPAGAALESQAVGPPVSTVEMGHSSSDWTSLATQIETATPLALSPAMSESLEEWIDERSYPELFQEAFGTNDVTPSRIAMAIATYERTLFSDRTPFDLFIGGNNALTAQERRGRTVFNQTNCNACHGGATMTNDAFLYIGVRPTTEDLGRFEVDPVNRLRGAFKVPGLRNVELRAPFMHNGQFETLDDVVAFYNRGGDFDAPNKAPQIIPRNLDAQQLEDLAAFLGRPLTDPRVANESGPFKRPVLFSESDRVPVVSGTGRTGTGGNIPEIMAIEPPVAGNPSFTVGLSSARANANAVLVIDSSDPGVGTTIPASGSLTRQTIDTTDNGTGFGYGSVNVSIPSTTDVVDQTFFGRWYVTDPAAVNGFSVSNLVEFTVFGTATNAAPSGVKFDFDGDSKSDISIYRPGAGQFWYLRSSDNQNRAFSFGTAADTPVPADFTGDGLTDVAFWRESTGEWFVLRSEDQSFYSFPFGTAGDIPAPGDFDGDGTADTAVYRPSNGTWFILNSSDSQTQFISFGSPTDKPLVGDYDGDGQDDVAVFKPDVAQFWQLRSTHGQRAYSFGQAGDQAMTADFTGDGSDDMVVWRPSSGEWFVLRSDDESFFSFPFGTNGDIPSPGDYDGDGVADPTVFRPSDTTWYSQQSTNGAVFTGYGASGDTPLPSSYVAN